MLLPTKRWISIVSPDRRSNLGRPLRKVEADLILAMARHTQKANEIISQIPYVTVEDMNDGGMGSLHFFSKDDKKSKKKFGVCICEARFFDSDGVLVSAHLDLDKDGRLFELDLWKVDFSPLQQFPDVSAFDFRPWSEP